MTSARGQRTVRKLLDAGIDVFGSKGYFPARVDDIVKVAKTSHGTFYLAFCRTKKTLFRALALDVADEMRSDLSIRSARLTADAEGYDTCSASGSPTFRRRPRALRAGDQGVDRGGD